MIIVLEKHYNFTQRVWVLQKYAMHLLGIRVNKSGNVVRESVTVQQQQCYTNPQKNNQTEHNYQHHHEQQQHHHQL